MFLGLSDKITFKMLFQMDLFKEETLAQVFSCEFCEISKNTFFAEHIRATAPVFKSLCLLSVTLLYKIILGTCS